MPIIYQVEVLSGPAAAPVWMCPQCGHGSSELRDERAHLDAHRQLRAFFQEWEAGTTPEPVHGGGRPGRWRTLVVAVATVLVLLLSVGVFSRINQTPDAFRDTVPATVVPGARPPVEGVVTPAPPSRPADPSPAAPAQTGRPTAPVAAIPAPVSNQVVPAPVPSTPAPAPAATVPPPVPSSGEFEPPRAPAHLLSACVLGICLYIL